MIHSRKIGSTINAKNAFNGVSAALADAANEAVNFVSFVASQGRSVQPSLAFAA